MFVDASALVAILTSEKDAPDLLRHLDGSTVRVTSAMAVWEASIAVARALDEPVWQAEMEIAGLLTTLEIESVAIPPAAAHGALAAFEQYGKGRHAARLNFGDCFAYACAKQFGLRLFYKGDDFALTDMRLDP